LGLTTACTIPCSCALVLAKNGDRSPAARVAAAHLAARRKITEELVSAGTSLKDKLNNFFLMKDLHLLKTSVTGTDQSLTAALEATKTAVDEYLCDSFNTPAVMAAISDLITTCNSTDESTVNAEHVEEIAKW
jgi:cysteinyl-tRNA synthetase